MIETLITLVPLVITTIGLAFAIWLTIKVGIAVFADERERKRRKLHDTDYS